jgi:hypothetical protein
MVVLVLRVNLSLVYYQNILRSAYSCFFNHQLGLIMRHIPLGYAEHLARVRQSAGLCEAADQRDRAFAVVSLSDSGYEEELKRV